MSINIEEPILNIRKTRLDAYERELGGDGALGDYTKAAYTELCREFCKYNYKQAFKTYYHGEVDVDGKRIALFMVPKQYMPHDVLGMTDGFSAIWLRDDLNETFGYGIDKRVLAHEKEHVRDPLAPEQEVRRRTGTERITLPYRLAA
jgi:hypothetical protein